MASTAPIELEPRAVVEAAALGPWADALAATSARDHVVTIDADTDIASIARPLSSDRWVIGPYVGELSLGDARLVLNPRGRTAALEEWVRAAVDLAHVGPPPPTRPDAGIWTLIALVWARSVDDASRHGPPSFRVDMTSTGSAVRGRLDVPRTVRLRARGSTGTVSVHRARELDNPVSRIIVAADGVLLRRIGHRRWNSDRVRDVVPQLQGAVGRRGAVPADIDLQRMRYTPITRPFKSTAELSARVVRQDSVMTTARPGRPQGLLLDIENVYGTCVLRWARAARPDLRVDVSERGVITLHHGRELQAVLMVRLDERGDVPIVDVVRSGRDTGRFPLPPDAADAAPRVRAIADSL